MNAIRTMMKGEPVDDIDVRISKKDGTLFLLIFIRYQ